MRAFIHTAWATVLLFGTKGNTRASECGTAIVQSRFFVPVTRACCYATKRRNPLTAFDISITNEISSSDRMPKGERH